MEKRPFSCGKEDALWPEATTKTLENKNSHESGFHGRKNVDSAILNKKDAENLEQFRRRSWILLDKEGVAAYNNTISATFPALIDRRTKTFSFRKRRSHRQDGKRHKITEGGIHS